METWRTPNFFIPADIFAHTWLIQMHHVSEINAPAAPGKLGRGILLEKLDRCGQLASKNPYPTDGFMLKGALYVIRANLCTSQIKASTPFPPRQPSGHLKFWKIFVQIPPSRGRKAVQMPLHRSIPGDQMPPPPGNFSVAFIMLRKLCM